MAIENAQYFEMTPDQDATFEQLHDIKNATEIRVILGLSAGAIHHTGVTVEGIKAAHADTIPPTALGKHFNPATDWATPSEYRRNFAKANPNLAAENGQYKLPIE